MVGKKQNLLENDDEVTDLNIDDLKNNYDMIGDSNVQKNSPIIKITTSKLPAQDIQNLVDDNNILSIQENKPNTSIKPYDSFPINSQNNNLNDETIESQLRCNTELDKTTQYTPNMAQYNGTNTINPTLSSDIGENAENLLLFKNKAEQTVEKNSQFASGEKMADNEVQEKIKPPQLGRKSKSLQSSDLSIETSQTNENDNLKESSQLSDIQPISSVTNTHQSFRRIYDTPYGHNDTSFDPLIELRNVAKIEANNFRDSLEEAYFSPPVSPSKHPLQYLKTAVFNEEKYQPVELRQRAKKVYRDVSVENESDLVDVEQNVMNDFDETIFNYNSDTKLFYCPWEGCGKSFPSLSRIKRHYIIHTKLKPFKCLNKGCIRRFSRKDNMLQHYRVHCPFANKKNT